MSPDESPGTRRDALDAADGVGAITRDSAATGPHADAAADPVAASRAGDRVIVGLAPDAGVDIATHRADSVYRELDFGRFGRAVAGHFSPSAIEALQRTSSVRYVEVDGRVEALEESIPWGVDRVDADRAHDAGYTGSSADVAIVDTGIDDDHPDLAANVGAGRAFVACGSATDCPSGATPNVNACNRAWSDDNDHGTHCAGIAAAASNTEDVVGVANGATLHAVKVLDACGSGSLSDVAAGIEYVADQGWDVASMSFGTADHYATLDDACQYAHDAGVLLVAAAGNTGPCTDCVTHPAANPRVVAVSATDRDDTFAEYSSSGPEVDIVAPGTVVTSTIPPESSSDGTGPSSGTSMAAPHVAGAGAILMANGQSNVDAQATLADTAEDVGLPSNEQGSGLLDVEAATNALGTSGESVLAIGSLDTLVWADAADCAFEWRPVGATSWTETATVTRTQPGTYSRTIHDLTADTEYEFRAVAHGTNGITDHGESMTFTPSDLVLDNT